MTALLHVVGIEDFVLRRSWLPSAKNVSRIGRLNHRADQGRRRASPAQSRGRADRPPSAAGKARAPILHDCGSLDPWLREQTRVAEKW
jgi:hypothetical protein